MSTPSPDYQHALDEFYRRMGRNVVIGQQIEWLLKVLTNWGGLEGTVSQIQQKLAKRAKMPDRRMLGQLIDSLVNDHLTPVDSESMSSEEQEEDMVSIRVTFDLTSDELAAFKQELEAVLAARNDLIHTFLLSHRINTLDGCLNASDDLERQRLQFTPMRKKLRAMVKTMDIMKPFLVAEMKRHLESLGGKDSKAQ